MKRLLILILCLYAFLPLTACSNADKTPIFIGMSISNSNAQDLSTEPDRGVKPLLFIRAEEFDHTTMVESWIYLNIHIYNPAEYEIISLKLNGKKYVGNYQQFAQGSTAENILIEIYTGDVPSTLSYTVSDIKWINGTSIEEHNVIMKSGVSDSISIKVDPKPPVRPFSTPSLVADYVGENESGYEYDYRFSVYTVNPSKLNLSQDIKLYLKNGDIGSLSIDSYDQKDIINPGYEMRYWFSIDFNEVEYIECVLTYEYEEEIQTDIVGTINAYVEISTWIDKTRES